MKKHHAITHMKAAVVYAKELSHSTRRQVACLVVQEDNQPVSLGVNGSYPGDSNCLEDENGLTKEDTYHAEENAIAKLAGSHASAKGAIVFVTLEPCLRCARLMARSKVAKVYYYENYAPCENKGINFLVQHGIPVEQLDILQ